MRFVASAAVAGLAAVAVGLLARPARYEVDGLSMAPGVMPGDVVATQAFPAADRARRPGRFERWIIETPAEGWALKRVAGLPGEAVAIVDGDLLVDGTIVLKSPRQLAHLGVEVKTVPAGLTGKRIDLPSAEVLDDAPFATEVNRTLVPVSDVGIAAQIRTAVGEARVRITCGGRRVTWRLKPETRGCCVAGRLDGHLVATAWRLRAPADADRRGCLPAAPDAWTHAEPWPPDPGLGSSWSVEVDDDAAVVERVSIWRDVQYRATEGAPGWRLGDGEFLVLGDFPTGSRDSRQWGPLPRAALRHRLAP